MAFRQIDVSAKPVTYRAATATGRIRLRSETVELIRKGKLEKGDPVSLAATTAIIAAKLTPALIALCHPLRIESTEPKVRLGADYVEVTVTVGAHEKTGVEMEALTAVLVALLNVWDVAKGYEKDKRGQYPTTQIYAVRVLRKKRR